MRHFFHSQDKRRAPVEAWLAATAGVLVLCSSCRTPATRAPATQPSRQEAEARVTELAGRIPPRPSEPLLIREWENLNVYLRKAQYLVNRYTPSDALTARIVTEMRNAEKALTALRDGRPPGFEAGIREEGYYSENDDSFQPFLRYVPKVGRKRKLPLIVYIY